jgi:hypothetical protein
MQRGTPYFTIDAPLVIFSVFLTKASMFLALLFYLNKLVEVPNSKISA